MFIIGGASCSGKTTIAKEICEKHGYIYFSADDIIKTLNTNTDEQLKDVIDLYKECVENSDNETSYEQYLKAVHVCRNLSDYIFDILNSFNENRVVAEGMLFLPEIVYKKHISSANYIALALNDSIIFDLLKERNYVKKYYSQNCDVIFRRNNFINEHYQKECMLFGYEYYKFISINDGILHVAGKIINAFDFAENH